MSSGTNPNPRGTGGGVEPRGVPVIFWPLLVVAPLAALLSWVEFKVKGRLP